MANEIRDIIEGLVTYFTDRTADLAAGTETISPAVRLAFRNERNEPNRIYPEITLQIYDTTVGSDRRYSGYLHTRTDNPDGSTAALEKLPTPIDLHIQLDTWCQKREHDWALQYRLAQLLANRYEQVVTPAGRNLTLMVESMDTLDAIEDETIFRKAYRLYCPVWFDSPAAAAQVNLVIQGELTANGESLIVADAG